MNIKYLAVLLLITMFACRQNKKSIEPDIPEVNIDSTALITAEIQVIGMTCEGCEKTICNKTKELPGVIAATASYTDSLAIIRFDTTLVSISQIRTVIDSLYYVTGDYTLID